MTSNGANFTVVERDSNGNIKTYLNAQGRTVGQTFDAQDRLATRTEPDGIVTTWTYKNGGQSQNLESVATTGMGTTLTTKFEYNSLNQRTTTTDPTNVVSSRQFDPLGRLMSTTVAGVTTEYKYDPATGFMYSAKSAGRETLYAPDAFGRVGTITDPMTYKTKIEYDDLNRITMKTYPDQKFEQYIYADPGQGNFLKTFIDRAGRYTTFDQYDTDGRLTTKTLKDANQVVQDAITYGYNAPGQLESESSCHADCDSKNFQVTIRAKAPDD